MTARLYDVASALDPSPTGIDPVPAAAIAMHFWDETIVEPFSHSDGVGWTCGFSDMTNRRALVSGVSQTGFFGPALDGSASGFSDNVETLNNTYPPPTSPPRKEAVATYGFYAGHLTANTGDVFSSCGAENARNQDSHRAMPIIHLGSRTDAAVGSFDLRDTPGLQSVTGLGFQPDIVILLGAHRRELVNGCAFELGAFDADGNQWAVAERAVYLSGPTIIGGLLNQVTRRSRFVTDSCLLHIAGQEAGGPTSVAQRAEFSSMDAGGFTIDVTEAGLDSNGTLSRCVYLALRLVGGSAAVGSAFQDDAAITVGFAPDAMLFASNLAGDEAEQDYARIQLGLCDQFKQRGFWGGAASGSVGGPPPPSAGAFSTVYALFNSFAHGSVDLVGDGADITWDLTDSVARPFGWIAFLSDDIPTPLPSVETDPADAICNRATLCATVNPGSGSADVYFDWGPTIAYGFTEFAGTLTGAPDLICVTLTGLATGATYHYRARIIVDGVCVFLGDDMTFTVGPCGERLRVISEPNATSYHTPDLTVLGGS